MRRWLIVFAFLLVGCVEGETAVPTMTMAAERPSPTDTLAPTPPTPTTAALTRSPAPIHTPIPSLTNAASPTRPPATLDPLAPMQGILLPALSSQGQLAFVQNQVLFLETATNTNEFKPIAQYVTGAYWSPQGNRLLYEMRDRLDALDVHDITWILHDVQTDQSTPLREIIANLPPDFFGFPTWMENGHKILLGKPLRGEISLIDLETKTFSTPLQLFHVLDFWELEGERLLIQDHFGAYSNSLWVFDINGDRLWSYPNPSPETDEGANAGVLGFSEEHGLLAILEPSYNLDIPTPVATLYRFDTETFELTPLWTKPTTLGFHISPTGELIALCVPGDNYVPLEFQAGLV